MDSKTDGKEKSANHPNQQLSPSFESPRHWVTMDELTPEYWSDENVKTLRSQEFSHKPIETLEAIEKMDAAGVSRREFLTIMGASMAMASFACARRPVNKIIPYVVQPQEVTPGVALYYASTCRDCSESSGILVRTREGRPVKLEGNDLHPGNNGALSARAQASLLNLYDPDRIKAPMKGSKGGSKTATTWAEVDALVVAALKEAKKVRWVSLPQNGDSTRRIMKEFLSQFQDGKWIEADPIGAEDVLEGQVESYGTRVFPMYKFDQADVVASFGADFLGTWGPAVTHASKWAKKRKLEKATDSLSKCYVFEANLSTTGASADERFAIVPGAELAAAMALAYELVVNQKKSTFAGHADIQALFSGVSFEDLLLKAGSLEKNAVKKVAESLWNARGKSIVVGSGSLGLQTVVNFLNTALENDGKTVDGTSAPITEATSLKQLATLQAEMESGAIDVLVINRLNPIYFLPNSSAFAEAMKKVKLVVSINDRVDETSQLADVVLSESHYLEAWGDAHPQQHIYSLQQPAISPMYDTRSFEECVLAWGKGGIKTSGLLSKVASGTGSYYDYVKENWQQTLFPSLGKGQSFNDFWETTLQKGVVTKDLAPSRARNFSARSLRVAKEEYAEIKPLSVSQSKQGPVVEGAGVALALYQKMSMGDGRSANNAWLQEMPDPISTVTWDNYVNIGPAFAKELNLKSWDVVSVRAGDVQIELPVNVQPGIAHGVITIAVGYGRTQAGQVGNHVGTNAFKLASFSGKQGFSYGGQRVTVAKTGKRYELAAVQEHNKTEERPLINDITYAQFQKNPAAEMHTNPHLRMKKVPTMWKPPVDYSKHPYRWMMSVDLNACSGCGACIIACQAENNIPTVGRDRIRMGREMHWIRVDRYYSGDENSPKVLFQPMMCQHCENAPCETVCPVAATTHSEDGLNQMTYSRCVGTRYCQNNCPYKVRRFNFFDHWKDYKDSANMVWNPDVTVRSRGIMEKCTFCVQRINEAKSHAKDTGKKIKDSDLKTACQQTCPTDAIVFGNVNDAESLVVKMKETPRAFRSLEILNTKPSVHYLTKVRNIEGGGQGGEHHQSAEETQHEHS